MLRHVITLTASTKTKHLQDDRIYFYRSPLTPPLFPIHPILPVSSLHILPSALSSFLPAPSSLRSLMTPTSHSSAAWWWTTSSVCWTTYQSDLVSPTWCSRLSWCCWRSLLQRSECTRAKPSCCYSPAVINPKTELKLLPVQIYLYIYYAARDEM